MSQADRFLHSTRGPLHALEADCLLHGGGNYRKEGGGNLRGVQNEAKYKVSHISNRILEFYTMAAKTMGLCVREEVVWQKKRCLWVAFETFTLQITRSGIKGED